MGAVLWGFTNKQCLADVSVSGMSCIRNCMRECRPRSSSSRQLLQDVLREVEGFETTNDALKVELIDKEHKDGSSSDGNEQAQAQQKGIKVARKSKLGKIGKEPKSKDVEKKDTLREQEIIIKELKKKIVDIIIAERLSTRTPSTTPRRTISWTARRTIRTRKRRSRRPGMLLCFMRSEKKALLGSSSSLILSWGGPLIL